MVIVIIPTVTISVQTFIVFHLDIFNILLAISLSVVFCLFTMTQLWSTALYSYPVQSFPLLETSMKVTLTQLSKAYMSTYIHVYVHLYPSTNHRVLLFCKTTTNLIRYHTVVQNLIRYHPPYNTNFDVTGSSPILHLDDPKVLGFQRVGRRKGIWKSLTRSSENLVFQFKAYLTLPGFNREHAPKPFSRRRLSGSQHVSISESRHIVVPVCSCAPLRHRRVASNHSDPCHTIPCSFQSKPRKLTH